MKTWIVLVFGIVASAYSLNQNVEFLNDLKEEGIFGSDFIDTEAPNYKKQLLKIVDNNNANLPALINCCTDFLTSNLSSHETSIVKNFIQSQDQQGFFQGKKFEDFGDEYKNIIGKLLENSGDSTTTSTIEFCKMAPWWRRIFKFLEFFEWLARDQIDNLTELYKNEKWHELLDLLSERIRNLYYEDTYHLHKHSKLLKKTCTGSAMVFLHTKEKQDVFRKLLENGYIRGAYEWAIYNIDVSSNKNFYLIQKAFQICLKLQSYSPDLINTRLAKRNTMIDIRQIIRETMETPELANKLDLEDLLRSMMGYVENKASIGESRDFVERFVYYCEEVIGNRSEIANYSGVYGAGKSEEVLEENKCHSGAAHLELEHQILNTGSALIETLAPYCQFGLSISCQAKYDTTYVKRDWFNHPYQIQEDQHRYHQHGPNPSENLMAVAKNLTLKN
ncbi:unnamed protein product [Caenorhabditis angaria]|uniref:Uncharacterized protein n=1 Tax=Caenorhabditis angaria TaxID=860376 RepID=A0A9P1NCL5_9PELO|nr:unnamed protein product [Caenorhabditis angaria]